MKASAVAGRPHANGSSDPGRSARWRKGAGPAPGEQQEFLQFVYLVTDWREWQVDPGKAREERIRDWIVYKLLVAGAEEERRGNAWPAAPGKGLAPSSPDWHPSGDPDEAVRGILESPGRGCPRPGRTQRRESPAGPGSGGAASGQVATLLIYVVKRDA
ncbi:hypothetical protein GCM10010466_49410 [Planomonospora alba]|uniref:Uncharacterized protein n=1 Tax=Planomonospora alba TaxID=161354 RepID=A0ABP6NRQ4_9ACTN